MATSVANMGTRLATILQRAKFTVEEATGIEYVVDNGDGTVDVVFNLPVGNVETADTQETFRFSTSTHAEPSSRPGTVA